MAQGAKIATCCYCGTRAALVLRGKERHELACSSCGAPLHDLKGLRVSQDRETKPGYGISHKSPPKKRKAQRKRSDRDGQSGRNSEKRRKKDGFKRFFEEAFDVIDDIFD